MMCYIPQSDKIILAYIDAVPCYKVLIYLAVTLK